VGWTEESRPIPSAAEPRPCLYLKHEVMLAQWEKDDKSSVTRQNEPWIVRSTALAHALRRHKTPAQLACTARKTRKIALWRLEDHGLGCVQTAVCV
jgi:hypothetical protein